MVLGVAVSAALLSPAMAEDLSGRYSVKGQDPEGSVTYEGQVTIAKKGSTFHVAWLMEDHRAFGTGILTEKTFAVTYMAEGLPLPGLAVYEVGKTGQLSGSFTLLGASDVGFETWTPLDRY
jgi:hypothetical protein